MRSSLFLILCAVPFALFADARFVEAPAECHVPWDNANVDNEYKIQSCNGQLNSRAGGVVYDGALFVERQRLPAHIYVIDGHDVWDLDAYPSGILTVSTSGEDSATDCNIVSNGATYSTGNWEARIQVQRTENRHRVDVTYELSCWGAAQAQ